MKKIGVIGAGSWGTALAITAAAKGHHVSIWGRNREQARVMKECRENTRYLPGVKMPANMEVAATMKDALTKKDMVLFSVPAQSFRKVFKEAVSDLEPDALVVNVAKGIEQGTLLRLSQVAQEIAPRCKYVVLSGPSHAEEVGKQLPTTVVVGAADPRWAKDAQDIFITDKYRVYTSDDVVGIELGGSLKNIIALGAGISDGMGYGDNAKAALITRGLAEINRLALALGARTETLSGLAGVGDLIVTCTSIHSRNRRCGISIGKGDTAKAAVEKVGMVVEGITTTKAAYDLAQKAEIEMPVTAAIYRIINGEIDAAHAESLLMGRQRKAELG